MDNLTHTLSAVVMSRAGLNRLSPHATLILAVAVNVPDLDVLAWVAGPSAYLQYHRGPSHSLVAMPLVALAVTIVFWLFKRRKLPFAGAYVVALIGVASNPIFDLANSYGVRLLWPFSGRWIHADFLAIFDVWIWALLLAALIAPWFSRLVSAEIGATAGTGRGAAVFALCAIGAYSGGMYLVHERAVAVLESHLYQGEVPLRVAALPSPVNPLRWTGLVEGTHFVEVHPGVSPFQEFDPTGGRVFYKPAPGPEIAKARATKPFRVFLDWAQWPLWRVIPDADPDKEPTVELMDLRFGEPGNTPFRVSTRLQ
ncbi:MAG TPA: metal-dependent hydrolase [Bryobacteraceae bacterium]|nr:metal-dependent hydrolase [Bryobacteraceae bacterium]